MRKGILWTPRIHNRKAAMFLAAGWLLISAATQPTFAADPVAAGVRSATIDSSRLSPDLVSLAKLLQSNVDDKVVVAFIQNSAQKKNPTADELVYLHELGLSDDAMVALLNAGPKVPQTQTVVAPPPTVPLSMVAPGAQPVLAQEPAPAPQPATVATSQVTPPTQVYTNAIISAPPAVVYTQPAPATIYVEPTPVVRYVEPVPTFSFGLSFGHFHGHGHRWGHHHGHR